MDPYTLINLVPGLTKKTPDEWEGPCPFCGGKNRFSLRPFDGESGRWFCRKPENGKECGKKKSANGIGFGDGIALVRALKGMGYRDACAFLGVAPKTYNNSSQYHGAHGHAHGVTAVQPSAQIFRKMPEPPRTLSLPGVLWRNKAAVLTAYARKCLQESEVGQAFAYGRRFLDKSILDTWIVGWIPQDRYEYAREWGIEGTPEKPNPKIRIPRGLLLASERPAEREKEIVSIVIRRPPEDVKEREPRFWEIRGGATLTSPNGGSSRGVPFIIGDEGKPVVLVESALDACLIWCVSGGAVSGIALNGVGKPRDTYADAFISKSPLVLASPDNDEAGGKAWKSWREWYPQAVKELVPRIPMPGKDGEYSKDWGDLEASHRADSELPSAREWLREVLLDARDTHSLPGEISQKNRQNVA